MRFTILGSRLILEAAFKDVQGVDAHYSPIGTIQEQVGLRKVFKLSPYAQSTLLWSTRGEQDNEEKTGPPSSPTCEGGEKDGPVIIVHD